jgi:hypothetical protein
MASKLYLYTYEVSLYAMSKQVNNLRAKTK